MRKILVVVLFCLLAKLAHAQEVNFYLYITDKDRIVEFDNGVPIFDDDDINAVFSSYELSHFAKAFPLSEYDYLQKVYLVTADSIGLAEELYNLDSVLFPYYAALSEKFSMAYYPDDWDENTNDTSHLILINAPQAWDIEKGNSNTVVGLADWYFNTQHEDMHGQYANVLKNLFPISGDTSHGTFVASLIAAKTNNDTGTAAIGYNCKLNVFSDKFTFLYDSVMLAMVKDTSVVKTRVLNASWGTGIATNYYWNTTFGILFDQGIYTEIYERGIPTIAAAGNANPNNEKNNTNFVFPASYDHVLSVSSIGHEGDTTLNSFNGKHVHEFTAGDSTATHQHNTRVDLCAPGMRISGHDYKLNNPGVKYKWRSGWGTSMATPMVSGTVGLMASKMPWLTPYQIEYVLKKSSFNHYSISHNQKYAGPTRWKGRIGAGTLNAWAALDSLDVDSFIADYPTTLTFRIKGISLNTKCQPGKYAGVPIPRLDVVMENGVPPYRYKWEQLPGNNAWIFPLRDSTGVTNITSTIPSLISSIMGNRVHYRLTVYDNSEIEKVASYILDFQLKADSTYDLAMQDSWADQYDEPNQMLKRSPNNWDIWTSPDLWNRLAADLDTTHQDPDTMVTNHMHVRIKNVGCAPSPDDPDFVNVHLYWTLLATGEIWDRDWIGGGSIKGIPPPPTGPFTGGEITPSTGIPIPPLAVGEDTILTHPWTPPNPHDFDTTGLLNRIEVCALARIDIGLFGPNYGMKFPEVDTTKVNVLNNNNIVTRNFVSINLRTGPVTNPPANGIVVINPRTGGNSNVTVQLITENQLLPYIAGNLSKYMSVTVHLGELYDVWDAGGLQGNPTSYNEGAKTVTWNMEEPLRLENIELEDGDKYFVMLEFNIKSGISLVHEVKDKLLHFRLVSPQTVEIDNGDGTTFEVTRDYVHSAVNYNISITEETGEGKPGKPTNTESLMQNKTSWFEVYPNPVSGQLTVSISENTKSAYRLTVTDISGKVIFEDNKAMFENKLYHINTSLFTPGVYHIQLIDKANKTQVKKFVKVE